MIHEIIKLELNNTHKGTDRSLYIVWSLMSSNPLPICSIIEAAVSGLTNVALTFLKPLPLDSSTVVNRKSLSNWSPTDFGAEMSGILYSSGFFLTRVWSSPLPMEWYPLLILKTSVKPHGWCAICCLSFVVPKVITGVDLLWWCCSYWVDI